MVIEVGVEFTLHELGVLAQILELPTAAGIEDNPVGDLPDEVRSYVVDSVVASLEARQVVSRNGDTLVVADAIRAIVGAASVPGVVAVVSRQVDTVIDTTFLSVTPELGVEVSPVAHTVYRLTPFAPSDLLTRILRLSDLHPTSTVPAAVELEIAHDALDSCAQRMLEGDDAGAMDALGGPGTGSDVFLEALRAKRASAQVTILHKPGEGRVEGGAIAWMDAGFRGVWTVEALEEDHEPTGKIRIANVDSIDIAKELFSFLPKAFTEEEPLATADA